MNAKNRPALLTVTDCRGGKEHEVEIMFPPSPTAAGFVRIGQESYQVECVGSMDDFTFRKPDGTTYAVSCWGESPANRLCDCRDYEIFNCRRTKSCKHLGAIKAIREAATVPSKAIALETIWEN